MPHNLPLPRPLGQDRLSRSPLVHTCPNKGEKPVEIARAMSAHAFDILLALVDSPDRQVALEASRLLSAYAAVALEGEIIPETTPGGAA